MCILFLKYRLKCKFPLPSLIEVLNYAHETLNQFIST